MFGARPGSAAGGDGRTPTNGAGLSRAGRLRAPPGSLVHGAASGFSPGPRSGGKEHPGPGHRVATGLPEGGELGQRHWLWQTVEVKGRYGLVSKSQSVRR